MWIVFIIACACVILDQVSKLLIEINFKAGQTKDIIPNFLYITKTYNTGAGWSIFDDNTLGLAILSLVATIILIFLTVKYIKSFKHNVMPSIALALCLGGCVGNMVDRFLTVFNLRDGVIDFVGMYIGSYEWPIYNVADIMLVVGIIVAGIWIIFLKEKKDA